MVSVPARGGRARHQPWRHSCFRYGEDSLRTPMHRDIDYHATRVDDEEAAHAPRLIGQRIDHLCPVPHRVGVDGIHVVHFDGHVRHQRCAGIWVMSCTWAVALPGDTRKTIQPMSIVTVMPRTWV